MGAHCTVEYTDTEGTIHRTEVEADTLKEAALLGVAQFRKAPFEAAIAPATRITVRVRPPETVHTLCYDKLEAWLEGNGKTPREQAVKTRLRELLK